jgi:DNA processing protein
MEEELYLAALSVMRSCVVRDYLSVRSSVSAYEFYTKIPFYERCRVAGHIASVYSGSPIDVAQRIQDCAYERHVRMIFLGDNAYPELLSSISTPPMVLYCIGTLPAVEMIAIVGTRESSKDAESASLRLAADLGSFGAAVVSGMARGIDRHAHLGALENGYPTVGVLAHGIDKRYPAANLDLFDAIERSKNSALISEYPPGVKAGQWTFALRNRIISGLSRAVIVVQAGIKSGAMITARYAAEQGRDLYAVGGMPYDDRFAGCRTLIQDGGSVVGSGAELFPDLQGVLPFPPLKADTKSGYSHDIPPADVKKIAAPGGLSPEEEKIIAQIDGDGKDIDEVIRQSGLPSYVVAAAVVSLEIAGIVERRGSAVVRKR